MHPRIKRAAKRLLLGALGGILSLSAFAAEIQTSVRSSETDVSAGEPITFILTFSNLEMETQRPLTVYGDIWGDAADRPSELAVQFAPGADCEYFSVSGKFHCKLNVPAGGGIPAFHIQVRTQKSGLLEIRGHTQTRSQLNTWASEPVRILASED